MTSFLSMLTSLISNDSLHFKTAVYAKIQRRKKMDKESSRCFAWFISFKKSCNERWAKFRNQFRRRFYARREQKLDPSTLLNETGTNNFLVIKKFYKSNKVCPIPYDIKMKEIPSSEETDNAEIFDKLVEEYVSRVIAAAAETVCLGKQQSLGNTAIISVPTAADDNTSLSSSIISQMADAVVTESLTNIVHGCNRNQSAGFATRPKTGRNCGEKSKPVDICIIFVVVDHDDVIILI